MKLNLELLESLIELPTKDLVELRNLFDDIALEVEGFEKITGQTFITIETLAQRGDHLSALGVAREIRGRFGKEIKLPKLKSTANDISLDRSVKIATDKCFNYNLVAAEASDKLDLPKEVTCRLLEVKEDKHPLVNISNYVLAELGQPTHVFDTNKVKGSISIVLSSEEEEIEALDGKIYRVPENSLLIKDEEKTIAVAGVIGCANSAIDQDSREVLIESADFDPVTVRKTARKMGLSTDASYAFERGVDSAGLLSAIERIFALANLKGKGFYYSDNIRPAREISLSIEQFRRNLNQSDLQISEVNKYLEQLGYTITGDWIVEVPSWRYWNVVNPETVMEDYGRAIGFNSIVPEEIEFQPKLSTDNYQDEFISLVTPALLGAGYNEVITRSYYSADDVEALAKLDSSETGKHLKIINSLEGAYSNLKTTNLLHLARLAVTNQKFGIEAIKVFELGRLFTSQKSIDSEYQYEADYLTIGLAGRNFDNNYQKFPSVEELVQSIRGLLDNLLTSVGLELIVKPSKNLLLHPGRQSDLFANGQKIGVVGDIHPELASYVNLKSSLIYAELNIAELMSLRSSKKQASYSDQPISKFELTFKLPKDYYAGELKGVILEAKLPNLVSVSIVDSFTKSGEDFNRISYRLNFQHPEKTLTSEEVDSVVWKFVEELKQNQGIEIVQ